MAMGSWIWWISPSCWRDTASCAHKAPFGPGEVVATTFASAARPATIFLLMATTEAESVWNIARLLAWTREHFAQREMESPRLCAELLLAHALGCERIALYTRSDAVPDDACLAKFRELVREAATGAPIAYLTGR